MSCFTSNLERYEYIKGELAPKGLKGYQARKNNPKAQNKITRAPFRAFPADSRSLKISRGLSAPRTNNNLN